MKIIVIGANGQLGSELCQIIESASLVPLTHADIEVTSMDSVRQALIKEKPTVVINTAGFVRVDDCEVDPERCFLVNTLGARNVAVVTQECNAKLVYISTDYVFGGETGQRVSPYTEFDTPVPPNTLGKSKLAGEKLVQHLCNRHFIVRVSGLFGKAGSSGKGGNFVETILRLVKERDQITVVNDQVFSPTYATDAAKKIVELVDTEYYGTFHITNKGACSWYEFTAEIFRLAGVKTPVTPITSDQYPQKATRPHYSVLDNYHLRLIGMDDMRPWQEAMQDYLLIKGYI